jgi:hypothetical protein
MPVALQADRGIVQALYMQGFSPPQIAAKTGLNPGTITTWSHRYGWKKARAQATEMVKSVVHASTPILSKTVAGTSDRVRESLATELEKQVNKLAEIPIAPGLNGLARKATVTKLLVDAARPVMGWDDQKSSSAVSVESMLDVDIGSRDALPVATVRVEPVAAQSDTESDAFDSERVLTQCSEPIDPCI